MLERLSALSVHILLTFPPALALNKVPPSKSTPLLLFPLTAPHQHGGQSRFACLLLCRSTDLLLCAQPKKTPIPNDKVHFNPFPPGSVKAKVASDMEIGEGMEHSPFSEHFGTPDKPHGKGFVPSTKGCVAVFFPL